MTPDLRPCGTRAAYARHIYHGEEPCDDCRDANAERTRESPAAQAYFRARSRAAVRLARLYPEEFEALVAEERQRTVSVRGIPLSPRSARARALSALPRRHPERLASLLAEERAKQGCPVACRSVGDTL